MERISRARLLAVAAGAAVATVAEPLASAHAAPEPQGDDLGFVGFAATTELVLLSLYRDALETGVLSRAERAAVRRMREDDLRHYDALVPLLGEAAPVASSFEVRFRGGTFRTARSILLEVVALERLLVGTLLTGLATTQDDETRLLLARLLQSDSFHLAAAQSTLRGGPAFPPSLPRPLSLEGSGAKLDTYLG